MAADRLVHIHILRNGAQRRGPEAACSAQKATGEDSAGRQLRETVTNGCKRETGHRTFRILNHFH